MGFSLQCGTVSSSVFFAEAICNRHHNKFKKILAELLQKSHKFIENLQSHPLEKGGAVLTLGLALFFLFR